MGRFSIATNHRNSTIFLTIVVLPDCKRYKYIPLGSPMALNSTSYVPADLTSFTKVATSLPRISNTRNVVGAENIPEICGMVYIIVVVGLNGFG